jgi:hypothetical protein
VGLRTVLGAVVKRKIFNPHRESNPRTPIAQPVLKIKLKEGWRYVTKGKFK